MPDKKHGQSTLVYVDQYNWGCALNTAEIGNELEQVDITTFCDEGMAYLFGKSMHTLTMGGFFVTGDGTTTPQPDEHSFDLFSDGTLAQVLYAIGPSIGDMGYEVTGKIRGAVRQNNIAGAIAMTHDWQGEKLSRGPVLFYDVASAGAAAGTEHEALAEGDTWVLTVRVVSVEGAGTIACKVEEAPDGSSWADVASAVSGNLTATGITRVTGTVGAGGIGAHYRINFTTYSGFTDSLVLVTFGKDMTQ